MLDLNNLKQIRSSLQRIFVMKVTRSSYREIQNYIINVSKGDKHTANQTLLSFLSSEIQGNLIQDQDRAFFEALLAEFSSKIRLAKEIQEKGDFINVITSDQIGSQQQHALINRIRRIDGEEFHFVSDKDSSFRIIRHFLHRLLEFKESKEGFLQESNQEIQEIQTLVSKFSQES